MLKAFHLPSSQWQKKKFIFSVSFAPRAMRAVNFTHLIVMQSFEHQRG
jgi:hypothetical protein